MTLRAARPSALLWLLCAGSAGLYLFGMDFLYDVENGIFTKGGGGAFEAVVVALTLLFSVTVLSWSWRHRGELLSGDRTLSPAAGSPSTPPAGSRSGRRRAVVGLLLDRVPPSGLVIANR